VLATPDPVVEPALPATVPSGPAHLRATGLGARWSADRPQVLIDIDLDLPPGRRTLVVGPSGSGKTSLAMVLLRLLDFCAGTVDLNGVDVRSLDGDDVRRVVGLLAQDAHVFDTTVRENLRIGRSGATDEALRSALGQARLLEWVDSQRDGLDTWVGAHGDRMSGGERQRLALARVLLADAPVLVLDEPTEHLDPAMGDALVADLVAATRGRTVLAMTHRLHGFEDFDEVLVLDTGRVVERGSHAALMAEDGWYATAYREEELVDGRLGGP
jgi:ATP-binding cassette subfamily C protein CydCD